MEFVYLQAPRSGDANAMHRVYQRLRVPQCGLGSREHSDLQSRIPVKQKEFFKQHSELVHSRGDRPVQVGISWGE